MDVRLKQVILVALWGCAQCFPIMAASGPVLLCETQTTFVLPHQGSTLVLDAPSNSWVEIEEVGQQVKVDALDEQSVDLEQPLRYGWHWRQIRAQQPLSVDRVEPISARGTVIVRVYCSESSDVTQRRNAMRRAQQILAHPEFDDHPSRLPDLLTNGATTPQIRALAWHVFAMRLALIHSLVDSADAFDKARMMWADVPDGKRALAARVGQISELNQAGNYTKVIELLSREKTARAQDDPYLLARLLASKCAALSSIGAYSKAHECLLRETGIYRQLGEYPELVNQLYVLAQLEFDLGNLGIAEQVSKQALGLTSGTLRALTSGKLENLLALVALHQGRIDDSVSHAFSAIDLFENASEDNLRVYVNRWLANVYLTLAQTYLELGSLSEAFSSLNEAVSRLTWRNDPSRMAAAMSIYGHIAQSLGYVRLAEWSSLVAESAYSQIHSSVGEDRARSDRLTAQLALGNIDNVRSALAGHADNHTLYSQSWSLLALDVALRERRTVDAHHLIDSLHATPISLRDGVRLAQYESTFAQLIGDPDKAQEILVTAANRIRSVAAAASNAPLRQMLMHETSPLRRDGLWLLLQPSPTTKGTQPNTTGLKIEEIWRWLVATAPVTRTKKYGDTVHSEAFDQAVATELLATNGDAKTSAIAEAGHELLGVLAARTRSETTTAQALSLTSVQQNLPGDGALIAYVDGGVRGGLLWITRSEILLLNTENPTKIADSISSLNRLLSTPTSPIAEIDNAAYSLSADLLSALKDHPPPAQLWVLDDDTTSGIGWSALRWPGSSQPLIETTAVSMVRIDQHERIAPRQSNAPFFLLSSSQPGTGSSALPLLPGAEAEAGLITRALPPSHPPPVQKALNRNDALAALATPDSWVHFSAHGTTQPRRLGYSGIWLDEPATSSGPQFLSALDIVNIDIRADTVVLDVCQAAGRDSDIERNLNIAESMSVAGAQHVVASLWQISDSASNIWAPAFYAARTTAPNMTNAQALRQAQQKMRSTRNYRHPFYWSGLISLDHI